MKSSKAKEKSLLEAAMMVFPALAVALFNGHVRGFLPPRNIKDVRTFEKAATTQNATARTFSERVQTSANFDQKDVEAISQ